MDNNLCLYCGNAGHSAKDCNKAEYSRNQTAGRKAASGSSAPSADASSAPAKAEN